MHIHIKRIGQHQLPLPTQQHDYDAGWDLCSTEDTLIIPGDGVLISTGFAWEIPQGFVGLIRDRSGLAANYGITVRAGVIDSGYRGEIKVALRNENRVEYGVNRGDRIAQMLIVPCLHSETVEVKRLSAADRGEQGFGSTGT